MGSAKKNSHWGTQDSVKWAPTGIKRGRVSGETLGVRGKSGTFCKPWSRRRGKKKKGADGSKQTLFSVVLFWENLTGFEKGAPALFFGFPKVTKRLGGLRKRGGIPKIWFSEPLKPTT